MTQTTPAKVDGDRPEIEYPIGEVSDADVTPSTSNFSHRVLLHPSALMMDTHLRPPDTRMTAYRRYSQLDSLVSLSKGELLANHLINKGKLTYKQLEDIREAFVVFDKNRDGMISTDEVSDVCHSLNVRLTASQLQEMVRLVDNDGNGQIDFEEFVRMMAKRFEQEKWERDLQRAFQVFDKDGDGFIDITELKRTMYNLGECLTDDEIEDMMREADRNGDGKVDYEEFSRVLNSAAPS